MKQLLIAIAMISAAAPSLGFAAASAADPATSAAAKDSGSAKSATDAKDSAAPKGGAAKDSDGAKAAKPPPSVQVIVVTSLGSFTMELNAERAPLTVAHFLKYVDQGQYTGTIFHRVIPNFVIQGGGFDQNYKLRPAPSKIVNESGNGLNNERGTVGMARGPEPHSGDCQFYVNLYDNEALDPSKTRWGYAVFGKVIQGMDVVDKIGNVPTGARGPIKEDTPLQPVIIEKIERVPSG
jgi:peptidyl-prolyl cis-trans isomerase A (cyclophilin A)/peptidyl-prolyl cis-trans isomerase B (cyclophilin B)